MILQIITKMVAMPLMVLLMAKVKWILSEESFQQYSKTFKTLIEIAESQIVWVLLSLKVEIFGHRAVMVYKIFQIMVINLVEVAYLQLLRVFSLVTLATLHLCHSTRQISGHNILYRIYKWAETKKI